MRKPSATWKPFVIVFAVTLVGYFICFQYIERRRVSQGPWEIEFKNDASNLVLTIRQPHLGIETAALSFTNLLVATNLTETVRFTAGREVPFTVPFGRCVFQDPLFLPGTVALEIGGHELVLMPRHLTIDGAERAWSACRSVSLGERTNSSSVK